jgi:hypothetical protein
MAITGKQSINVGLPNESVGSDSLIQATSLHSHRVMLLALLLMLLLALLQLQTQALLV